MIINLIMAVTATGLCRARPCGRDRRAAAFPGVMRAAWAIRLARAPTLGRYRSTRTRLAIGSGSFGSASGQADSHRSSIPRRADYSQACLGPHRPMSGVRCSATHTWEQEPTQPLTQVELQTRYQSQTVAPQYLFIYL